MERYYICPFRYCLVLCTKNFFLKKGPDTDHTEISLGGQFKLEPHPHWSPVGLSLTLLYGVSPRDISIWGTIFDSSNYPFGCSNKSYFNLTFEAQRLISMKILLLYQYFKTDWSGELRKWSQIIESYWYFNKLFQLLQEPISADYLGTTNENSNSDITGLKG